MAYSFELTAPIDEDFRGIYDYIANRLCNPIAGDKLFDKIYNAILTACEFPRINPIYKDMRKIIVDNYLLFYEIHDETRKLVFLRALYGAMDIDKYL